MSGGSAEMATQPTRKVKAVSGMRWMRPPRCSMSRSPVAAEHGARAEEQEALEQRMIEHVQQRRGEGERRRQSHAIGLEGEREPQADEDDADILHRVIGEQALQIVLHQRVEHAHDAGDAGKREHHHAPPPFRAPSRSKTMRTKA